MWLCRPSSQRSSGRSSSLWLKSARTTSSHKNVISLTRLRIFSGSLPMPRRRFYAPPGSIRDGIAVLSPDQAHHLRDVLRLRTGDPVEVFDGEGNGYAGQVDLNGPEVCIRGLAMLPSEKPSPVLILAA